MQIEKKMTRRRFLGKSILGLGIFITNSLFGKKLKKVNVSKKEARHYRSLAG